MDPLEQERAVRLPLPEKDHKEAVIPHEHVVRLSRQLNNALRGTHDPEKPCEEDSISVELTRNEEGQQVISDHGQLFVQAAYDVRTGTCYNCTDASMEETSFLIYWVSIDGHGINDTRYCRSCATEIATLLETYIDQHVETLLADHI